MVMPYYVYLLKSLKTGTSYVGHTNDLSRRIVEHNSGKNKYTKNKAPWELIYHEEFQTRSDAMRREKFYKSVEGRLELKKKGFL